MMKYTKIRGVEKEVCTAEQKIAYNIAFANRDYFSRAGFTIADAARAGVEMFCRSHPKSKFDVDAIFSALMSGLEEYYKGPSILWDYESIGKTFPALYLK